MSEGPIHHWWRSHKPPTVTTTAKDRVCIIVPDRGLHPYCGRRAHAKVTFTPSEVTCSECVSAMNADTADHTNGGET